jgi:hypothetical protein
LLPTAYSDIGRNQGDLVVTEKRFCFIEIPRMEGKEKDRQKYLDTLIELEGEMSRITTIRLFFSWRDLAGNARNAEPSRGNLVPLRGKPDRPWKVAGLTFIRRRETMAFLFKPFGKGPKRVIDTV